MPDENKQISMTLPALFVQAMDVKGAPFNMTGAEWLKQQVCASAFGADIVLRLGSVVEDLQKRERVTVGASSTDELPLGGGRKHA